ncbi:GyrI-like domain-containing protein [Pelagicoccus sp. SDUM812003]|uniref:GyrI-like domain-containing protein n=1 Tax=Pelagicoccus sp. SDUM812003 TaxID=3041267 RepID=UPI0028105A6B|nr:GyrI-like domain-containing protein [Pelagicoccus sp. SDUM812003]MDQ8203055.1 GyrI-like domain-containing protein [Pelagicoccus sp. SDUM812003]
MNLKPDIVVLPPSWYVGLQTRFIATGTEQANTMIVLPELWNEFFRRASEISSIAADGAFFGLSDTPESRQLERRHPDEGIYLASAQTSQGAHLPPDMNRWSIPGGMHLKFEHHGHVSKLSGTITRIYDEWFPNNTAERAQAPTIERYDHRFDPFSDNSMLEILVPIRMG